MELKYLTPTTSDVWNGRVDHESDPDALRFHQVIRCITPNDLKDFSPKEKKVFCLVGFCCDEGVRRNKGRIGAAEAPDHIRRSMASLPASFYQNAHVIDLGNIVCQHQDMEGAQHELSVLVSEVLNHGFMPLVLGGGHEIVFGHYLGIATHVLKSSSTPPLIINLDAHFDLRPTIDGIGTSGTPFNQIAQKHLSEGKTFDYVCIGTQPHGNTKRLYKRADELGVTYFDADDIIHQSKEKVLSLVVDKINHYESVYLTLDFDVLNCAYAPGVSAIQPLGISPETLQYFVKGILKTKKVISLDIAEVCPKYDIDNRTSKLAAAVMFNIISSLTES